MSYSQATHFGEARRNVLPRRAQPTRSDRIWRDACRHRRVLIRLDETFLVMSSPDTFRRDGCLCLCVCVCVRKRERGREKGRVRMRAWVRMSERVCVCAWLSACMWERQIVEKESIVECSDGAEEISTRPVGRENRREDRCKKLSACTRVTWK